MSTETIKPIDEQWAELRAKNDKDKQVFVQVERDHEVPEDYQELITEMIHQLCLHGFSHGWCGDVSQKFKEGQINHLLHRYKRQKEYPGTQIIHPNSVYSNLSNLRGYMSTEKLLKLGAYLNASQELLQNIKNYDEYQ